jgi:hypothetical protein
MIRTTGRAAAPKTRKRKKGNTTYAIGSLDPPGDNKVAVEDIRIWDVSTSERTGRVSARKRTVQHHRQVSPSQLQEVSTSSGAPGIESTTVDEAGIFADSESPPEVASKRPRKKRANAQKDNDSVSQSHPPSFRTLTRIFRREWKHGFSSAQFF